MMCGGSQTTPTPPPSQPAVLVGAGDIAVCGNGGAVATALLLDQQPGTVFTAGDSVYQNGTTQEFQDCYDPTWGRHRARTRPVPGNHDYGTPGAAPYFAYFGANAGTAGQGYYTYQLGSWLVVALNSEIDIGAASPQLQWLRTTLAASSARCTLAYWHRPLHSSGPDGENPDVQDIWRVLYQYGVEFVVNGHDHLYERFALQDPDGRLDVTKGIRQFTVGTGGAIHYSITTVHTNSEYRLTGVWGVMVFTLTDGSYRWEFLPTDPLVLHDFGIGDCH
jgi:hypothetical protein